jgi:hypothetical protein
LPIHPVDRPSDGRIAAGERSAECDMTAPSGSGASRARRSTSPRARPGRRHVAALIELVETKWARYQPDIRIEMVLSGELLNLDVDQWSWEAESTLPAVPIGCRYAFAIRSLERMLAGKRHRSWHARWRVSTGRPQKRVIERCWPLTRSGRWRSPGSGSTRTVSRRLPRGGSTTGTSLPRTRLGGRLSSQDRDRWENP